MLKALAETSEQVDAIIKSFNETTKALIAEESYKLDGERSVLNIVRGVFRVVPIWWVATQVVSEPFSLD